MVICSGTQNLYAIVKNAGGNTIYNYVMNWSVDGVAQPPTIIIDSIFPAHSDTVLLGSYNFINTYFDIEIFSSLPNGVADTININDTVSIPLYRTALNGSFTIGATGDYTNFFDAVQDLEDYGVCGSVVFNVDSGVYQEQVTIGEIIGASPINTVTFQSVSGINTDVSIQFEASDFTDNWVVGILGGDYIILKDLNIKSLNPYYSRAVFLSDFAVGNKLIGNILEAHPAPANNQIDYHKYNMAVVCAFLYAYNNYCDSSNAFIQNKIINGEYGIYLGGPVQNTHNQKGLISENHIIGFNDCGVFAGNQIGLTIEQNIIESASVTTTCKGIEMEDFKGAFSILGNKIHTSSNSYNIGIYLYDCELQTSSALIANNFISHSNDVGHAFGISVSRSSNISIVNNSVSIRTVTPYCYGINIHSPSYSGNYQNIRIVNNSIANFGGGSALYISESSISPSLLGLHDHNNYFTVNPYVVKYGDSIVYTANDLSQFETNSIVVDPEYVGLRDLHTLSPFLNNAGFPNSLILDDIYGNPRDTLAPDIGAAEFTLLANDMGVSAINKNATLCSGTGDVFAEVRNYGINDVYSYIVNWSIDGVLQTALAMTDTIPVGGVKNVLLGSSLFYPDSLYNVAAWTYLPNNLSDGNAMNDSLVWQGLQTGLLGDYTIGSLGDFTSIDEACNYLNTFGVCGSTVFYIESGTYNEQLQIEEINGASSQNSITFKSSTGNHSDVVIQYSAQGWDDNWVVLLNGADYIKFQDLSIKSLNSSYCRVVALKNGAHHNSFLGNLLEAPIVDDNKNNKAIVYNWPGMDDSSNVFIQNQFKNGAYGVYLEGISALLTEANNIVSRNDFIDCRNFGVMAKYQNNIIIENNNIVCGANIGSSYTICTGIHANNLDGAFRIYANRIQTKSPRTNFGIDIKFSNGGGASNPALIANNVIVSNNGENTICGIRMSKTSNTNIYHNSINITAGSIYSHGVSMETTTTYTCENVNLVNNSISNTGLGDVIYVNQAAMNNMIGIHDFNNYHSSATPFANFGSTEISFQADLSVVEPHSKVSNPMYVSDTDLHSSSTYLNASGTPLTSVPLDFDGNMRDSLTPDIGAYEFHPSMNNFQTINLPSGWSMWSTYMNPYNNEIAIMLDGICAPQFNTGSVEILKNGAGYVYWPYYGLNQIDYHSTGIGYHIKMNYPDTLIIEGAIIDPQLTPINIPSGWSIIGYLRTTPMAVDSALSTINQSVIIVKNGDGNVYWPQYGVNLLGNMYPGQGYFIKLSNQELFYYPANTQ